MTVLDLMTILAMIESDALVFLEAYDTIEEVKSVERWEIPAEVEHKARVEEPSINAVLLRSY